ncbi:hypothetical protein L7F22_058885 [Adiantum nelumboides]|nr:hypothetical protein [Adiantum nelumboides]
MAVSFHTFYGHHDENARDFMDSLEMAHLMAGRDQEEVKLRAFPLVLKGEARVWYDALAPPSKATWPTLYGAFLNKYCGPFEILRRAGEQAYELALPPHMRIHNVFHVILLKKYVSDPLHILNHDDDILITQEEFQMEPEQVLEVKERKLRHRTLHEVLVKWKGYTAEDASWENLDDLVAQFSHFG